MPKKCVSKSSADRGLTDSFKSDFTRDFSFILEHYKEAGLPDFETISFHINMKRRNRGVPFEEEQADLLDLGTRAMNVLDQRKINTMGDIANAWPMLLTFRSSGKKTVREIKFKMLSRYYDMLNFKEREEFWKKTLKSIR